MITPLSFDPDTARNIVGDEQARIIEATARLDADAGRNSPPPVAGATYWGQVQAQMRAVVYQHQHARRTARNARKAGG